MFNRRSQGQHRVDGWFTVEEAGAKGIAAATSAAADVLQSWTACNSASICAIIPNTEKR